MSAPPIDPRLLGDEPAHPHSTATESYHHAFAHHRGLSKFEAAAIEALSGWIVALSARRVEPGYTDPVMADEAARLAAISAESLMVELARRMP